jgi:hypothetical protein
MKKWVEDAIGWFGVGVIFFGLLLLDYLATH